MRGILIISMAREIFIYYIRLMKTMQLLNGEGILIDDVDYAVVSQYQWRVALVGGWPRVFRMCRGVRVYLSGIILGAHISARCCCNNGRWYDYTRANLKRKRAAKIDTLYQRLIDAGWSHGEARCMSAEIRRGTRQKLPTA
jgi:hypothetical protein